MSLGDLLFHPHVPTGWCMLTLLRQVLRKLTGWETSAELLGAFSCLLGLLAHKLSGLGCFWKLLGLPQHGSQALGQKYKTFL